MQWKRFPIWVFLSLTANGIFAGWLLLLFSSASNSSPALNGQMSNGFEADSTLDTNFPGETEPLLGPRHHLTYDRWLELLHQEAVAMASKSPENLSVLVGDSLSLWFPAELLPQGTVWLNQGISGETTEGLLTRLSLLDEVEPRHIFVMIGINDLIKGVDADTIVRDQRHVIRYLKRQHPTTAIVLQPILPHGDARSTWEGRDRLLQISNTQIHLLDEALAQVAEEEEVYYLDLLPLFTNSDGALRQDLTTDGLHLNDRGYLVWGSALQLFDQLALETE